MPLDIMLTVIFVLTDETFYAQIELEKYRRIFALFLTVSGLVLIFKALHQYLSAFSVSYGSEIINCEM